MKRWALWLLVGGGVALCPPLWAQKSTGEKVSLPAEKNLRRQLIELERWGVDRLLRLEQKIDRQQKQRAHISTNPAELALLATDEDSGVRFYVASNANTPLEVLAQLAADPIALVRAGVALSLDYDLVASQEQQKLVETIALELARDSQVLVRLSLVENERLPIPAYEFLVRDSDPILRQRLARNRSVVQSGLVVLARDSVEAVRIEALKHPNMPIEELERASSDPSSSIRIAACQNLNLPAHVLDSLATDAEPRVRETVAAHPNTSLATLNRMAHLEQDANVLAKLAGNRNADRDLLMELSLNAGEGSVRLTARKRLAPLLRSEIREDILERWTER